MKKVINNTKVLNATKKVVNATKKVVSATKKIDFEELEKEDDFYNNPRDKQDQKTTKIISKKRKNFRKQ